MEHSCPICQTIMIEEYKIKFIDFYCSAKEDHFFAIRVKDETILKIKVRYTESNGSKIYLKVNFDNDFSQVWTDKNNFRVNIAYTFMPDFTDTDKLKNKIKTYLNFS